MSFVILVFGGMCEAPPFHNIRYVTFVILLIPVQFVNRILFFSVAYFLACTVLCTAFPCGIPVLLILSLRCFFPGKRVK